MKLEQLTLFTKTEFLDLSPNEKEREVSCAFTGHRELLEDFLEKNLLKTIESLLKKGVNTFYCGMAKGFDLLAGETILNLKKKYPNIKLVACVPYYGQEKGFSEKDKKRYVNLLKKADEKVLLSEIYYKGCLLERNRYIVDKSKYLIAYLKKDTGGTAYTVRYAIKKDLEILYL